MNKIIHNQSYRYSFHPPDILPDRWCDFRKDFEAGMTLKDIGAKYLCDQRTVRQCIILNKSSLDLGRQFAPTRLAPYVEQVNALYHRLSHSDEPASDYGIMELSRQITRIIAADGYQGSERTVRNHLRKEFFHADHPNHT